MSFSWINLQDMLSWIFSLWLVPHSNAHFRNSFIPSNHLKLTNIQIRFLMKDRRISSKHHKMHLTEDDKEVRLKNDSSYRVMNAAFEVEEEEEKTWTLTFVDHHLIRTMSCRKQKNHSTSSDGHYPNLVFSLRKETNNAEAINEQREVTYDHLHRHEEI